MLKKILAHLVFWVLLLSLGTWGYADPPTPAERAAMEREILRATDAATAHPPPPARTPAEIEAHKARMQQIEARKPKAMR